MLSRTQKGEAGDPQWQRLVDALVAAGTLRTPHIIEAFRLCPRSAFVPPGLAEEASMVDAPLPIGDGQTVSQPTTVATMLELVRPNPKDHVLDVGTGSGWQAALLAACVGQGGRVITIERVRTLAKNAGATLERMTSGNVVRLLGDATGGVPSEAPYDVIISAASSRDIPKAWIEQLRPGGRLLHPIAGMGLRLLRKDLEGRITVEDHPGYVFVPLVSGP